MFTPKVGIGHPSSASGRALASSGNRRRSSMGIGSTPYGSRPASSRSPYVTPLGSRLAAAAAGRTTPTGPSLLGQQNQFNVESCGSSLPALVMEALTFTERSGEMSAVLSACGWSWLVTGRRLLVWRYIKDNSAGATGTPMSRSRSDAQRPQFRELLLPQSDLAHRAQLVVLRQQDSSQAPSCMAVSPEGAVRYWPSIADENTYTEISAELQGQECESLVYLSSSLGYFLATTTSTTLLLLPNTAPQNGETSINVRQVKVPAGLLGGLSRKVTSLMFGSLPTQAPEARLVRVVCRSSGAGTITVLVLSAEHLQCWQLSASQSDTLLYEAPLVQLCQQALTEKLQVSCMSPESLNKINIWLLDMQAHPSQSNKVTVLLGAIHPLRHDLILALATLNTESCPDSVSQLTVLQHNESLDPPFNPLHNKHEDSPPAQLLQYNLLLTQQTAFIFHKRAVMCVALTDATLSLLTTVPFNSSGDAILGVGRLNNKPLFFSSTQGIVTLNGGAGASFNAGCALNSSILDTSVAQDSSSQVLSSTLYLNSAGLDTLNTSQSSPCNKLQAAFMYYNKEEFGMSQNILDELFPSGDYSVLSNAALKLSLTLLDDTPATDPRWAELGGSGSVAAGGGGNVGAPLSLIIANQIRDKSTAHKYYVAFLHQTGLWAHLSTTEGSNVKLSLLEHAQRLSFAATLRSQQQTQPHLQLLIDQAISEVIKSRDDAITGRLTSADLFYCKISKVQDIVWGLMQSVQEIITADIVPRDASAALHVTSSLVLTLLKAATSVTSACDNQQTTTSNITSLSLGSDCKEYIPWTASEGAQGIRTLLTVLHKALVETGLTRAEDIATKTKIYTTIVELTDQLLAGYQPQLASLAQPMGSNAGANRFDLSGVNSGTAGYKFRDGLVHSVSTGTPFVPETAVPINHQRYQHLLSQYQKMRYNFLQPLVVGEQYCEALSLGEKYCDFRTLVEVCDKTSDQNRLDKYMHQFSQQGFSDFVFRWHMETGKRGRLLSYSGGHMAPSDMENSGQWAGDLGRFLKGYSGLEWVHQLNTRNFNAARNTLKEQGMQETTYLSRKKTLLSLSKLCKIAEGQQRGDIMMGEEGVDFDNSKMDTPDLIQLEEDLILYQEQLPDEVLSMHNLEQDSMRVLTPSEMIELYTSDDNTSATELDFKKALDLLSFVSSSEEAHSLKCRVWARAVLKNEWLSLPTDSPMDAISDTVLFKTIELAYTQGCSLKDLLIPVDELLDCQELEHLRHDSGFNFLIQAGYEQIQRYMS